MLEKQNILLISPEPWGINFVSKHHYAVTLAQKNNTIYFLNPPSQSYSVQPTQYGNLYVVNYLPFLKGLRYLPDVLQRKVIRQKYDKLQELSQCTFDIVWSFDNSVFYDFEALPESVLKISHIVDLNQNFQMAKAAKTANICFGVADVIVQRLRSQNKNTYKVQHGYFPHLSESDCSIQTRAGAIKVMYVGNIAIPFIDWQVIRELVEDNTDVDFIFVGPDGGSNLGKGSYSSIDKEKVKVASNTYFIGAVPSCEIPSMLIQADILLVVYKEEYHLQASNSHKVLEYLASGKTVLASYIDEYNDKRDILEIVDKNEELRPKLKEILNNLSYYNCITKSMKRRAYALDNTYEKQIERIEYIINNVFRV